MNIVNLTPHELNVFNEDGQSVATIPASGQVARISVERKQIGDINGIPLFETKIGEPTGLPERQPDAIYVVSYMFRANFDREDLWQPGELLRNEAGQPIGCIGLSR